MSHPNLCTPTTRALRLLFIRLVTRPYMMALLCFFVLSGVTFGVFWLPANADELAPAVPGSITGLVKKSNGEPLAQVQVFLYRKTPYSADYWNLLRSVTTQADGKYRFTILPAGNYRIGVVDPQNQYAALFYPTAPTIHTGTDLNVAGNQLSGIDLMLYPGGRITGVVTATANFSLTAGIVALQQEVIRQGLPSWESIQSVSWPAGGSTYTFTNLSANSYRICANGFGSLFATYECYDNVYDINQATSITLTASATISNINLVLGDGADYAQISGSVTGPNHEALAAIDVYAIRDAEQPFAQAAHITLRPMSIASMAARSANGSAYPLDVFYDYTYARTDSAGHYQLATLPAGSYRLMFTDPTGNYANTYYNDSTTTEDAAIIPLVDKQQLTELNVQLRPASRIRGNVTVAGQPASTQVLMIQRKTGLGWQSYPNISTIAPDGHYEIGGLPAGTYRLWAAISVPDFYTSYFYQGYYVAANPVTAETGELFTEIPLTVGETKTADITLTNGPLFTGSLSGLITANGAPLAGAKVSLYMSDASCCEPSLWQPTYYLFTDATGRYAIDGLAPGSFRISAADPAGIYATTYYTAHANPRMANLLLVQDDQALTNINVNLPLAGTISGRVTRPNGQSVPNLLVSLSLLITYDNSMVGAQPISKEIRTDGTGRYTLKGLHPGNYQICFTDTERGYTKCYGMLWGGSYDLTSGRVQVTAGATTTGIDLIWGPDLQTYLPIIAQ